MSHNVYFASVYSDNKLSFKYSRFLNSVENPIYNNLPSQAYDKLNEFVTNGPKEDMFS
jgi:hypothetical protein